MKPMNHMDYECVKPNDDDLVEYSEFMCNPDNEYNCNECPERCSGNSDYGLPCGQQQCWVIAHCSQREV